MGTSNIIVYNCTPSFLVLGYLTLIYGGFLLLRYAEGAIYNHVICTVSFPIVTIFWTLFYLDPHDDAVWPKWTPTFTKTSAFAIAALYVSSFHLLWLTIGSVKKKLKKRRITINH